MSRNLILEEQLCKAIKNRNIVKFQYENDSHYRIFEPYAVYYSSTDKISVSGIQIKDESKSFLRPEPHNFEVALINNLSITSETFEVSLKFSSFTVKYDLGVLCAIDRV